MTIDKQLRWGGLWIILTSLLMNGMNILIFLGMRNATIQAVYGIGFTGLILSCTIIHIAQAKRSGMFGLLAYLLSVLSLVFANVVTFLILAESVGIKEIHTTLKAVSNTVSNIVIAGMLVGLILLGISITRAGIFPRWAGILVALGISLQFPALYALDIVGTLYFGLMVCGSILFAAGLIWIGWVLWSRKGWMEKGTSLSPLDRAWGAPFVIFSALLLILNSFVNSMADLTLFDGVVHLTSTTSLILAIVILHVAHANHAGRVGLAGFIFVHVGYTLSVIPAYFIMAQLAGQIDNNRALMASWVDIPIGRIGTYMLLLGIFLFGGSAIRAEVFPRGSGWLVTIGLALLLPSQFQAQDYLFSIFWVIGATLLGIGLGWMGWALLSNKSVLEGVQQPLDGQLSISVNHES